MSVYCQIVHFQCLLECANKRKLPERHTQIQATKKQHVYVIEK
jgi:hypothetical protein